MDDPGHVRVQYRDGTNLGARIDLHSRFSTNPYGWHRWVFDQLDVGEPAQVLDVGCGPGMLWHSELGRVPQRWTVVLCDRSPGMVGEAYSAIADDRFSFMAVDAASLPFADATFDLVVANHMLYHVPDRTAAVAEFARVLRGGGRLLASTNGPTHLTQLRELLKIDWGRTIGFDLETGGELLKRSFDDVRVERYEDSLRITEADAIVAYVRSMDSFWPATMPEADLRSHIQDAIDRDGAFVLDKDPGAFVAVRP